jgi:hypothetical protein
VVKIPNASTTGNLFIISINLRDKLNEEKNDMAVENLGK